MSDHLTADLGCYRFGAEFESVLHHTGHSSAPLIRWRQVIQAASVGGWVSVRNHAGEIMKMVADPRVLFIAATALRAGGPKAPGPNGLRLESLDGNELWRLCHALGVAIAADQYRPGPERVVWVKKASGTGKRPIVLSEVQDRVVQKAASMVLRPMLDMHFDPLSFAFRPNRSRMQAIAAAEVLTSAEHTFWVTHDIKDAFGRVPINRLLDVVFKMLPCSQLKKFLEWVLPPRSRSLGGIKQGGPLSPLMLEIYLTHFLHVPWREAGRPVHLLRYADDLLVVAGDLSSAKAADTNLRELLTPAGMMLKATATEAVRNLRTEPADWLGFRFQRNGGKFQTRLGPSALTKLSRRFLVAHEKCRPAQRALEVLRNWVGQLGPCFCWEDRPAAIREALETATQNGFEELLSGGELEDGWVVSYNRWRSIKKTVRNNPGYFVTGPVAIPTPTSVIW